MPNLDDNAVAVAYSPPGKLAAFMLPPVTDVATTEIHVDPANHRKVYDLESLLESIRKEGILQPPLLWTDTERGCYFVVFGNRRLLCAQKLGMETIQARVLPGPLTPREKGKYQLIENLQRLDIRPSEEASGYRELIDDGMTAREVAEMLSLSDARISRKLALLKLAPPLLAAVDSGRMPESAGWEFSHLKADVQLELAASLGELGRIDRDAVKAAVRQRTGKKPATRASKLSVKLDTGVAVSISGPRKFDWPSLLATLDRLRQHALKLSEGKRDIAEFAKSIPS